VTGPHPSARAARDSAGLLAGTLVNGLFAYVFFAMATRGLGAAEAAPVAVLWTYWGVATAVITFPVQHWIIRTMRASGAATVGESLPRMVRSVAAFAVAGVAVTWLVDEQLFGVAGPVFPALVGLVTLGSFFTGVVRGGLAGRERFTATALALAADNVVRVVLAAAVLALGGGATGLGVVLVAGALIGLAWPQGYRFGPRNDAEHPVSSLAFLGAIAAGSLLGQLVLIGGPAVLALMGGAPRDVTMLFATLAFFRAPYLLAVGVANRVTGTLTDWMSSGGVRQLHRFQVVVVVLTAAGAAAAAALGFAAGPRMVGLVFGADTVPPAGVAALVAGGSVVAVGNLAMSLLLIAQGRGGRLTRAWVVSVLAVAVVLPATRGMAPVASVTWAFVAGQIVAFLALQIDGWRGSRDPRPMTQPPGTLPLGSPS